MGVAKRSQAEVTQTHLDNRLLEQAQAALIAVTPEGVITHWNNYAEIVYGYDRSEAIGSNIRDLIIPVSEKASFEGAFYDVLRGGIWEADARRMTKNGGYVDVHVSYSPLESEAGIVIGAVSVSFDITQRVRTERRLAVSYRVSRILSEAEHIFEATPLLLEAICRSLNWSLGALWRVDRMADELRCLDVWHDNSGEFTEFEDTTRWMTFKIGIGVPGRVWEARTTRWIEDVHVDTNFPRHAAADRAAFHSALGFPILLRGEVLGAMEFFSPEIREPDEDLIELMTSIGSQVGQFMERKQAEEDRRMTEARKTAIVESALDCVITMDHLGYISEFNPAAEEAFGYKHSDAVGQELASLIIPPHLRDGHRKGLLRYLETGDGPVVGQRIEITAVRADGTEFPIELAVSRVDIPGPPVFTGYIRDITQRKESEAERVRLLKAEQEARAQAEKASRRLAQLQRITDAALSHLAVDDLLDELLARITETLGSEVTAILLVREDTQDLSVRAIRGLGIAKTSLPTVPIGEQAAGMVAATGEPLIVNDLNESTIEAPILRQEGMRSLMVVPLLLGEVTIGVLVTAASEPDRFSEDDLMLLRLAADRVAAPIQNANLFEREHRINMQLQRNMLPAKIPHTPSMQVVERYVPGGAGLAVGGDWYDVMVLPDGRVGLVIGDVVGKGIRAAAVMGQLRNSLRAFALEGHPASFVVERINKLTDSFDRATMATMIYLLYDPDRREMAYANAGHPPPLIRHPDGSVEILKMTENIPLGVMAEETYALTHVTLAAGSEVLLYTDGLIEEPGESIDTGLDRLKDAVGAAPRDLEAFCDHILEAAFLERERSDDVALLAFRPD